MKNFSLPAGRAFSGTHLIVMVSVFVAMFCNIAFFSGAFEIYSSNAKDVLFFISLFFYVVSLFILILSIACQKFLTKPVLIVFLILSSILTYFVNEYGVIVDHTMIENILETDFREASDLLNLKLVLYVVLLGLLPSLFILGANLSDRGGKTELFSRIKLVGSALTALAVVYFLFSAHYASFYRMQRKLMAQITPTHTLFSAGKYVRRSLKYVSMPFRIVGADAKIPETDLDRELIILVIGETARADHFSLNGYARETNPLLKRENVINFPDFWSCATTTAQSVPCIFSQRDRTEFERQKAKSSDNALDVLKRAGVSILWRDNNSSSKGVADRVTYEDFKQPQANTVCNPECRDEGMLVGLQEFIDRHTTGDILIVLHQMGNHGPAYYKRYPASFEKYTPVCSTNNLGACSSEQVINAYDNAILYTDYFLSRVIGLLKRNDDRFETGMVYLSDHGESLGENGLYLHGLPYFLAPETQKHVPAVMWFGRNYNQEALAGIQDSRKMRLSHDNMFSTLLGLFEILSTAYEPKMDILALSRPEHR